MMRQNVIRIGSYYDTTSGTLWKDGTYFPRGTRVLVTGLHIEQGYCVQFPAVDGEEALETWEDWEEIDFLAEEARLKAAARCPATFSMKLKRCSMTPRTAVICTSMNPTTSKRC